MVRKLGWASYSSGWREYTGARFCCLFKHICGYEESILREAYPAGYVAAMFLTVNATAGVLSGFPGEADSLKVIKMSNPNHPGYKHCLPNLYDAFIDKSHHGPHMCLVTNVLGGNMVNLRIVQPGGHSFPLQKPTLLALDYPHRECGLIHTGNLPFLHGIIRVTKPFIDVKPDNTLISVKYTDVAITQLLEESAWPWRRCEGREQE